MADKAQTWVYTEDYVAESNALAAARAVASELGAAPVSSGTGAALRMLAAVAGARAVSNKMADDLKRNGGFIPGVKPGQETSEYLDKIMSLITFPGSLFLVAIAVLPAIVNKIPLLEIDQQWALFYGGTSLLILVGVAIDTMQQVNSYLLNRHYDGLMKTGKKRR